MQKLIKLMPVCHVVPTLITPHVLAAAAVITTNSLVAIIVIRASASTSTFCFAAATGSHPPRLVVVLPPINLRLHDPHLPLPLPSMVGCYVLSLLRLLPLTCDHPQLSCPRDNFPRCPLPTSSHATAS